MNFQKIRSDQRLVAYLIREKTILKIKKTKFPKVDQECFSRIVISSPVLACRVKILVYRGSQFMVYEFNHSLCCTNGVQAVYKVHPIQTTLDVFDANILSLIKTLQI